MRSNDHRPSRHRLSRLASPDGAGPSNQKGNISEFWRQCAAGTLRSMRNRPSVDASPDAVSAIDAVLDRFGPGALRVAASAGVRLVHLRGSEAYRDRSRALRRLAAGVDDWR